MKPSLAARVKALERAVAALLEVRGEVDAPANVPVELRESPLARGFGRYRERVKRRE